MSYDPFSSLKGLSADLGGGEPPVELPTTIAISEIRPDPNQPRKIFHEELIDGLASSIEQRGLIQPIIVRHDPQGSGYLIIAGERRYRACVKLAKTEIPAIVRDDVDETAIRYMQVVENLQRADLGEEVIAKFVCDRVSLGESQKTVADGLGLNPARVSEYLQWNDFPEEIRRAVIDGKLSSIQNASLLYRTWTPESQDECLALLGEESIRRADIYALRDRIALAQEETAEESSEDVPVSDDVEEAPEEDSQYQENGESETTEPRSRVSSAVEDSLDEEEIELDEDLEEPELDAVHERDHDLRVSVFCSYRGEEVVVRYDLSAKDGYFWVRTLDGESVEAQATELLLKRIENV